MKANVFICSIQSDRIMDNIQLGDKTNSSNDYAEHLHLLAEKHKEQSSLFYTRHNLFIAYNTFLVGALALLVTAFLKAHSRYAWAAAIILSFVATVISYKWYSVMKKAAKWIDFWHTKVIYFEEYHAPAQEYYFFLDRMKKDAKLSRPKKVRSEIDEKKIEKIYASMEEIYADPPNFMCGIAYDILRINEIINYLWMWAMFLFLGLFLSDPDLNKDLLIELKANIILFILPLMAAFVLTLYFEYKHHWSNKAKKYRKILKIFGLH